MSQRRNFIGQLILGSLGLSLPSFKSFKETAPSKKTARPLRILFQGDSITDGGRWQNSNDWNHLVGQSYPYLISAKIGYNYPKRNLQFFNRGISGNTVTGLKARWQKDCLDLKPDILSILVGINDVSAAIQSGSDAAAVKSYEENYRRILQQAREANPSLLLVLCDPFVFNLAKIAPVFDSYSSQVEMREKVVKQLAVEFDAIHITLGQKFKQAEKLAPVAHWSWDGIHPMPAGHELIAEAWIAATSKILEI